MSATMGSEGGRQVHQRVEVLELTGPHDGQQAFDGPLTFIAPSAKHDLPPLHGGSEGALGGVVRGRTPSS